MAAPRVRKVDVSERRHQGAGFVLALALHGTAIYVLMQHAPVRSAIEAPRPLTVALITPVERPAREEKPAPQSVTRRPPAPAKQASAAKRALPPPPKPAPVAEAAPAATPAPVRDQAFAPVAVAPSTEPSPSTAPAPSSATPASAPGASAQTVPAPARPAPVTEPRYSADYLQNPAPRYPPLARRMGQEGKVVLRVLVNPAGTPDEVELRTSSGSEVLDAAALDAVRRWRFVPARRGDAPVPAWVLVPITFTLQG